jgi:hypothetical protein
MYTYAESHRLFKAGKTGERNCAEGYGAGYKQDSGYCRDNKG